MIFTGIMYRKSWRKDEGSMGFHDYVTKYQDFEDFVREVEIKATEINSDPKTELISISYPDKETALITYRVELENENDITENDK